ncbi:OLC1v1018623C1 [Oldenlandia corymbosa var. corymbosa]|uniref:OLC1v1018623C1 n=1 Tax=Oldenlandia corymbosa var. corymbosa TaxID=529605 RepID=A0AAV1EC35_OLDCO|nr:OLC1v1018623C1 [Oldenlandia corymbosa var. corymbosa]
MWRGVDFNPPDEYEHEAPGYADGSKMVTVKLRHSGGFILQRGYKYVEGEVEYFDDVNYELLTVEALYKLIDNTWYCRPHKLFYLVPDDVGTPKFTRIEDDEDIDGLIEMKTPHGLVEVFRIASIEFDPFMKSVWVDNEVDSNEDEDEDEDYVDSEFEMSEDDEDFRKYVDERLESTTWYSYRSESKFVRHEDVGVGTGSGENESDDDCGSCDDLHSIGGSDEDDDSECHEQKDLVFDPEKDMGNPKFQLHQQFATKWILLAALRQHGIKDRRKINFQKNDMKFVRGYCENCNWEVYGVKVDDEKDPTFQIRTVNTKHTCGRVNSSRNVNSDIVSDWYVADFADDPNISVSHLQFRVLNEHRLTISRTQAWNAKRKALEKVRGKITEQYADLECYMEEVTRANPGTSIQRNKKKRDWINKNFVVIGPKIFKKLETYKDRATGFSCEYAGNGKYEPLVDPPQPKKKGKPPKAKITTNNAEPHVGQKRRMGPKPTPNCFCVYCKVTGHFISICPALEKRREKNQAAEASGDVFPSLIMTMLLLQLQEIRDAEANMAAGRPHDEIPPLCECCDQYGHTADTCEVMDFCNWMQDNNMDTEGGGAGQTIGPENSEPVNDTTTDDVILLDEAVKSSERSASVTKLWRMGHATGAGDLGHHQTGQTAAVTAQVIVSSEEPGVSHAMNKKKKANKNVCAPIERRCSARLKAAHAFKKKNDGLGETAAEPVVLDDECPKQTKKPKSTKA